MAHRTLLKTIGLLLALAAAGPGWADVFTSKDGAFTLDMPAGWTQPKTLSADSVLTLQKGTARLDIKKVDCSTEMCIEQKITSDLAEVKSKKMQVIGNSYTGEEVKRIEFSTGDPFFYISFFTPKNDFSAGYFLIDKKAYSILAKDLSYAETDLVFSFISPVKKAEPVSVEMDLKDPRAYDIAALPAVHEETLELELPVAQAQPPAEQPAAQTAAQKPAAGKLSALKKKLARLKVDTLLSKHMPPYVRRLGHGFDVLVGLFVLFALLLGATGCIRPFVARHKPAPPANPNSLYPIKFKRLYGTPSLIFRAKDNQGNILTSLSSRWDSVLLFGGLMIMVLALLTMAGAGYLQATRLIGISSFIYSTLYSACSLAIPLGAVVFFCGIVWSQLVLREITLFDRRGQKAAVILQKGFGWSHERYEIYFARSKEVLTVTRKRFALRRMWQLLNKEGMVLASVTERSAGRAVLRKICGHLWGWLRADYDIEGQMDCKGSIENAHAPFDKFLCNIDKPQALNARDMLAVSLLINIRDKDKWYPWFN